jgi:hypothetical protein
LHDDAGLRIDDLDVTRVSDLAGVEVMRERVLANTFEVRVRAEHDDAALRLAYVDAAADRALRLAYVDAAADRARDLLARRADDERRLAVLARRMQRRLARHRDPVLHRERARRCRLAGVVVHDLEPALRRHRQLEVLAGLEHDRCRAERAPQAQRRLVLAHEREHRRRALPDAYARVAVHERPHVREIHLLADIVVLREQHLELCQRSARLALHHHTPEHLACFEVDAPPHRELQRRARADRGDRRAIRVPDVRLLVLRAVHQREADEQRGRQDRAAEDHGVEQLVVLQVHEEQDDERRLEHRDRHRDREVDVRAEVDLRREHRHEREDEQRGARREQHAHRGGVRDPVVAVCIGVVVCVVCVCGHGRPQWIR